MTARWKKVLCTVLIFGLLLGLCACGEETNGNETTAPVFDGDLPESVLGYWYPQPYLYDTPIEIYADMTCVVSTQKSQVRVETVSDDCIIPIAGVDGEHYLEFQRLTTSMPILLTGDMGYAVQDPELWNYMIEWYCPESGNAFVLDFEELIQTDCVLRMENGCLTIEERDGDTIRHTVVVSGEQAVVTDFEGNSQVFYPIDGGTVDNDVNSPEARYYQAVTDLQTVISGGRILDYVDDEGERHLISGADAMEKLYHTFVELQQYMDVSEYLNMIHKIDDALLEINLIATGGIVQREVKYNCFGQFIQGFTVTQFDVVSFGAYELYRYDQAGNIKSLSVCGMVSGVPIFNENGQIMALEVWSVDSEQYYTAPVTLDDYGRIIRVEVPFVDYENTLETDYKEVYELLYGDDGKLIQYSQTKYSYAGTYETTQFYLEHGFYDKNVVECYYDSDGNLERTIAHSTGCATNGLSDWDYTVREYEYNIQGKADRYKSSSWFVYYDILNALNTPWEEIERMESIHWWLFHSDGFINSVGNDLIGQTEGHMQSHPGSDSVEYEYGSIYIYAPEG